MIVRYADDVLAGFEHGDDASRFLDAMRERFKEFALSLHPEKTRLIEFGRHATANREKRRIGKPASNGRPYRDSEVARYADRTLTGADFTVRSWATENIQIGSSSQIHYHRAAGESLRAALAEGRGDGHDYHSGDHEGRQRQEHAC